MYGNSYLGGNQYSNQYYPTYQQPYGTYQTQQVPQRQMQQQAIQTQEIPFNDVKFATEDEAKAYIVMPNTKVMLMDRDKSIFYIKSADAMGKSTLEGFKYSKLTDNSTEEIKTETDTKEFVKTEDLKSFITKEDLKDFLTVNDFDQIMQEIDRLKKRIQIKEIEKRGSVDEK